MSISSISGSLPPPSTAQQLPPPPDRATALTARVTPPENASASRDATAAREDSSSQDGASASAVPERLRKALEEVREAITPVAQNLLFSVDEDTGRTIIKVVDSTTDEVIRQIPSEELLAIAKALDKLQGVLIQEKI